jgi:hypothetical protein
MLIALKTAIDLWQEGRVDEIRPLMEKALSFSLGFSHRGNRSPVAETNNRTLVKR